MTGSVYLIGAGPGAADLITVRAMRLLARADIVFYDALVHPETLAFAAQAKQVAVGKRCGALSTDQRFINRALVEAAQKYDCVVRLKGGDPMLFGRAEEELQALREAGIQVEVVPGVTAALAASADLQVSLTRRGLARSVTFATPRVGEDQQASDWAAQVAASDTVALYMASNQCPAIARQLLQHGRAASTPVVVVESASLPSRRVVVARLGDLTDMELAPEGPALLLIGEVYRETLQRLGTRQQSEYLGLVARDAVPFPA